MTEDAPTIPAQPHTARRRQNHADYDQTIARATVAISVAAFLTFAVGFAQWCALRSQVSEMKRVYEETIEAESPSVYVYGASIDTNLLASSGKSIDSVVEVDFENFGRRAAIIRGIDIDWKTSKSLLPEPAYSNARAYSAAIRPPNDMRKFEPIRDNLHKLHLDKDDVAAITAGDTFLWIYGFVEIELFLNRTQKIGFCLRWYGRPPEAPHERFTGSDMCPAAYVYRH